MIDTQSTSGCSRVPWTSILAPVRPAN